MEKIPIFVWGAILAIVGGYLALEADAFSWAQLKAILMLVLGFAAVAYDVVERGRRLKQNDADEGRERSGGTDSR